jgi:hypothetical protein
MVSFQMIGVEPLNAGSGSFHATFSVGLQVVGSPVSMLLPSIDGPRQCGQLSAASEATAEAKKASIRSCRRMVWSIVPISLRRRQAGARTVDDGRRRGGRSCYITT